MNNISVGFSRGPAQPATRPMRLVLDSLLAQRAICGGEACRRANCHRCHRMRDFRRKEGRAA